MKKIQEKKEIDKEMKYHSAVLELRKSGYLDHIVRCCDDPDKNIFLAMHNLPYHEQVVKLKEEYPDTYEDWVQMEENYPSNKLILICMKDYPNLFQLEDPKRISRIRYIHFMIYNEIQKST